MSTLVTKNFSENASSGVRNSLYTSSCRTVCTRSRFRVKTNTPLTTSHALIPRYSSTASILQLCFRAGSFEDMEGQRIYSRVVVDDRSPS